MSDNENNKNIEFDFTPVAYEYDAGSEAKIDEENAGEDNFDFVQQDKSIHDTKFDTKPTTFMRDAMRRFVKSKSSVVAAVILGILFILAIILPIDGVLPYDTSSTNSYETNLPMKLFETGTGWWDGTRVYENQVYPYNDEYPEDDIRHYVDSADYYNRNRIVEVSNTYNGMTDVLSDDSSGGFISVERNVVTSADLHSETIGGYYYSSSYAYDFSNTYEMSYTLGWREDSGYYQTEYDILFTTTVSGTQYFFPLTGYSMDYGEYGDAEELSEIAGLELGNDDLLVTPYETQTVNLTELVLANEDIRNLYGFEEGETPSITGSFGFAFKSSSEGKARIMIHDVTLTSSSSSTREQGQMSNRSITDGSATLRYTTSDTQYWRGNSSASIYAAGSVAKRCDIKYDMYERAYGTRIDLPNVPQETLQAWADQGLVNFTYDFSTNTFSYSVNDVEGAENVYVEQVISATQDSGGLVTFSCAIKAYKYLGYDSMPIHVFGTDAKGKDVLKYTFSGLRTSLILGIIVAAINVVIGVIWGSISGYFGGNVDLIMERITDILSGMPWIVLMTILCIKLGQTLFVFGLALCLTGWIGTASVTRSQFYRYKNREYVLAARTLGAKSPRLIFRHVLPNAIGTIITNASLMIPSVIFNEATISYLGLGLKGLDSLGVILSDSQAYLLTYPYQMVVPAVIISLLMICFNLFGNGLRDAFNPSLKGSD